MSTKVSISVEMSVKVDENAEIFLNLKKNKYILNVALGNHKPRQCIN